MEELATTAFLSQSDATGLELGALGDAPATLEILHYSSDVVQIAVASTQAKLLVLNRSFFPAWRAWLDGSEVTIVPVDEVLMGVLVPAGEHVVAFEYLPLYTLHGMQYKLAPDRYLPQTAQ